MNPVARGTAAGVLQSIEPEPPKKVGKRRFTFRQTKAILIPDMSSDQFWSIFAMPIGLLICFGPIVITWVRAERRDAAAKRQDRH